MNLVRTVTMLAILLLAPQSWAASGYTVAAACYYKGAEPARDDQFILRGAIVKYTFSGTTVSRCDTIFHYSQGGMAQYPTLSFDGTKVAFFRWGVSAAKQSDGKLHFVQRPGILTNPNNLPDTNWVSVMNIDGGNLRNLVMVDPPDLQKAECVAAMDWPCGDWIYYEKPTKSGEIWRVNVNNPVLNEQVVRFIRRPELLDNSQNMADYALWLRRFSLAVDAKYCAAQMGYYTNNTAFCFPPPDGDVTRCWPFNHTTGGCNTSMSASGRFTAQYYFGAHCVTEVHYWDGNPAHIQGNPDNYGSGLGQGSHQVNGQCNSEMIRWSANSDKWLCQLVHSDDYHQYNQLALNWTDGSKFNPANNPAGYGNDAGDLWIDGGAANIGKYEDRKGNWISVDPVLPRDQTPASAPANVRAAAVGAHTVTLEWNASTDAETNVFCYYIYRGGVQVDTAQELAWTDSNLIESTPYSYQVSALNRGALESAKSAAAAVTTGADAAGPAIAAIDPDNGPAKLVVVFDEPVTRASAETPGNYALTNGVTVSAASLGADQKSVTLTTSPMIQGTSYALTVRNVADLAAAANKADASRTFAYAGLAHGLAFECYNANCTYQGVTNLASLTPVKTGIVPNFDIMQKSASCAIRFKGYIRIPVTGTYSFFTNANWGSDLMIDGSAVIAFDGETNSPTKMGTRTLTAGNHSFQVDHFDVRQNSVQSFVGEWLFAWYEGADGIRRRIPDAMLFHSASGGALSNGYRQPPAGDHRAFSFHRMAAGMDVEISAIGPHAVTIVNPAGSVVRCWQGTSPSVYRAPMAGFARGMYFVKVSARRKAAVWPVVVQ